MLKKKKKKKQNILKGAVRAWKILNFKPPRHFNIAILAPTTALKHQWKSFIKLVAGTKKYHYQNIILDFACAVSLEVQRILLTW